MKTWIKTTIAVAVIATGGLGVAGAAMARGDCAHGGERAHGHHMAPENMSERATEKLDRLGEKLALRADQRDAWDVFKESMRERAESAGERMQAARSSERPTTAPERMQRMEEMSEARLEGVRAMREATEKFYAVLDADQQEAFDNMHKGHRGAKSGHGYRHHGEKADESNS